MSSVENNYSLDTAEEVLSNNLSDGTDHQVSRGLEYPLEDSENFNPYPKFGEFDVIALNSSKVSGFAVADTVSDLSSAIYKVSKAQGYFNSEGIEHDYNALVFDNSVLSFRDAVESLPPVFTSSMLEEKWGDSEDLQEFYNARILGEMHTIPRTGSVRDDSVLPKNDYDLLEDAGLIEKEGDTYRSTETMDVLLSSHEEVYHVTPREEVVFHPSDFTVEL